MSTTFTDSGQARPSARASMPAPACPPAPVDPGGASGRLYFLDWVRILAFMLLIVYHTGMYYVTWGWHVKSAHTTTLIEPLMMLSAPWRLGLLFLIAGVAASHLIAKQGAAAFARQRSAYLLVPLIFGMFVIVPPQAWVEVIDRGGYQIGYVDFMAHYLSAYQGFCKDGDCLILPTWNHLWFLPYLWAYSLVLAGATALLGARWEAWAQFLSKRLHGWRILVVPAAVLGLWRILLVERFPTTHALIDDWYSHAIYLSLFLLGALLGRDQGFWTRPASVRWHAVALFLVCWAAMVVYYAIPHEVREASSLALFSTPMLVVGGVCCWSAIVAVCAFAQRHLNVDSPARRYLTAAVFPVYILHQTVIVVLAFAIKPADLHPVVEGPMLMAVTACLCFASYEVARRFAVLRPLFGIRRAHR